MLCDVSNRSVGPRGVQTEAGTTHLVEPGETVRLDLADHPLHEAWEKAGEISVAPVETSTKSDPPLRGRSEGSVRRRGKSADADETS